MKITGYRRITTVRDWGRPVGDVNGVIASGLTEAGAVIIETDAGIEGIGLGMPTALESLFPAIEGQDPRSVAALYDAMLGQVFKAGHQGTMFGGIAAIDMALWDIKAKAAGEPLWRLLGARDRWIPGYASGLDFGLDDQALHDFYVSMTERGFTAGKLKGGLSVASAAPSAIYAAPCSCRVCTTRIFPSVLNSASKKSSLCTPGSA